jgi:hypothetical protein
MIRIALLVSCLVGFGLGRAAEKSSDWQPVKYNGERAMAAVSSGWKAIVSLDRGRLVHFGPAESGKNLLFVPPTRDDPAGWGGDRVWLGPQAEWSKIWPPPAAWEHSGAESFTAADGILRMIMPDAGDGWPRLTRTYRWTGEKLICGVELSGGARSAQIIHIVQVPEPAVVNVTARPDHGASLGYVLLPSSATPHFATEFAPPPQVTARGPDLTLRHVHQVQKFGFVPQTLTAHEESLTLTISRGHQTGKIAGEPDDGFFTQVYLGGPEPFIELEQLSPRFAPNEAGSFTIEITGRAR